MWLLKPQCILLISCRFRLSSPRSVKWVEVSLNLSVSTSASELKHVIRLAGNYSKMADHATCPPLNRASVQVAHQRIKLFVHRTPVSTCETINQIASTPQSKRCPKSGPNTASEPAPHETGVSDTATSYTAQPKVKLFFKCENQQRVGAFKARGAFHALGRLIEDEGLENVREKGVCTHSSGM